MADAGVETCNGRDDDMDGEVDEDGANVGMPCGTAVGVCAIGALTCTDGELVCDGAAGGAETCNGLDDDCDGLVDETLVLTFFRDADLDGFGDGEVRCEACETELCAMEGPWVYVGGDCDDSCGACFPGSEEVCDARDNDCDRQVDEGVETRVYVDGDGDTFGAGEGMLTCLQDGAPPPGYVLRDGDCADEDSRANPGVTMMFTTPIRGVVDEAVDFDFDCDGREERLYNPCPSCWNRACWQEVSNPFRDGDPACGTTGRAQRAYQLEALGRPAVCLLDDHYEDMEVACR